MPKSESHMIRNVVIGVVLLMVSLLFMGCCLERVDVGNVGLKIKLAGSDTDRGVQDSQIKTGWVLYNPLTEKIVEFPISVQSVILTKDPNEGGSDKDKSEHKNIDESITFSDRNGININADVGFSFHIDPQMTPKLYSRFKQNDMRELAYSYMRNVIREAFNEEGGKMEVQAIYGSGKSQLINNTAEHCKKVFTSDGIVIDQLTINTLRLPPNITESINSAMAATQRAIEAENKVREVKAQSEQKITMANGEAEAARETARGNADALLIKTEAEAKAKLMSSDAEAKYNKIINPTLNPSILQYKYIDQWDGKLPQYQGGTANPIINLK